MKLSLMIVVACLGSDVFATDAFSFSLGVVSLGVAGLAGLKLYFGMKILGPRFGRMRSNYQDRSTGSVSGVDNQKFQIDFNITLPDAPVKQSQDPPKRFKVRRDAQGGIQLSEDFLRWLQSIDNDKCIHRFFCDLGAKRSSFGNLGRLTSILISMGGLPEGSWAQKMFDAGQYGKACPQTCDEHELAKTVTYVEQHLFTSPAHEARSEAADNEILTWNSIARPLNHNPRG